jgi:hypothetical protein
MASTLVEVAQMAAVASAEQFRQRDGGSTQEAVRAEVQSAAWAVEGNEARRARSGPNLATGVMAESLMVARGRVENGVVVLADGVRLAEGQEVLVSPFEGHGGANTPVNADAGEDIIAFLRRWRTEHPEPDETLASAIEESRKSIQPPHDPWE